DAGMDDYLPKPIKRDVLAAALAKWLPDHPDVPVKVEESEQVAASKSPREEGPSNDSALDIAVLAELADLMGEGLGDVISAYLSDTPVQLSAIEAAIGQRDYEVIGRCAHSVKSSSKSLGTLVLGRTAEALEMLARGKGPMDEVERLLAAMHAAFATAANRLREVSVAAAVRFPNVQGKDEQAALFVKEAAPAN